MPKREPPAISQGPVLKSFGTKTLSVNMDTRTVKHYVSCPTVDSDGDVLLPRGADISRFRLTGTVFDVHSYRSKDVVARNLSLKMQDDGVIAETRFSPRPPTLSADLEWWPDTLLWLYSIGDIKGWSVGFTILDARNPTKQDHAKYGEDVRRVITRWQVLEYSVAPLPANGDALTLSAQGILSKSLATSLMAGQKPSVKTPVIPKPTIRIEIPAEPVEKKHIVFFLPAQPIETQAPIVSERESIENAIAASAAIAIRKAQGQLYA